MRSSTNGMLSGLIFAGIFGYMTYHQVKAGNTQAALIMGGIGAAIIVPIVLYFTFRMLKGSLKVELDQKNVSSGQAITGKLHLHTKKAIHCDRLFIALIGERERRRSRSSSNSSNSTYWDEFYRDEVDVWIDQPLHAGMRESMNFEMQAPTEGQAMNTGQAIQKAAEEVDNEIAKTLMQGVGTVASALGGRKRWRVVTRLETKGVDLAASKKLHVSLKQL